MNYDCITVSFVLDIISELNEEEAGEAQHKYTDKFVTVERLGLFGPRLTLSGIQRVFNSLKNMNEHCLVSELIRYHVFCAVYPRVHHRVTLIYLLVICIYT